MWLGIFEEWGYLEDAKAGAGLPHSMGLTLRLRWGFSRNGVGVRDAPPATRGYQRPDRLNQTERPSALEETVERAEQAREGKGEDEPGAALFQGIEEQHAGHGKQSK